MADRVPLTAYLVLEPEPHLVAHECTACGARFFDRRNACAACSNTTFRHAVPATYSLGTDDHGTEAIGFGFEPIEEAA